MESLFDKIYCICMPDRKNHMTKFFKAFKIKDYEFIEPVLKTELEMKYNIFELIHNGFIDEEFVVDKFNFGRLANALSFIKTLQTFLNSDAKSCLIFEDDLVIPKGKYIEAVNKYMNNIFKKQVPKNWEYVNLGRCWSQFCETDIYITKNVISKCSPVCTHAITVKREMAKFLIENTLPLKKAKDQTWKDIVHHNAEWKDKVFCVSPIVFSQDRVTHGTNLDNNTLSQPECVNDRNSIQYAFMDEIRELFTLPSQYPTKINYCVLFFILFLCCVGILLFYLLKNQ